MKYFLYGQNSIHRFYIVFCFIFVVSGCESDMIDSSVKNMNMGNPMLPNLEINELHADDVEANANLFEKIWELIEAGFEIDYSSVSQIINLDTEEITYTFFMSENEKEGVRNLILTYDGSNFYPQILTYNFSVDQRTAVILGEFPEGNTNIKLQDIFMERSKQDIDDRLPKKKLKTALTPTLTIYYNGGTLETVYLESSPPEYETSVGSGGGGSIYWPSGSIGIGGNLNGGDMGSGVNDSMLPENLSGGGRSGGLITTPKVEPNKQISVKASFFKHTCLSNVWDEMRGNSKLWAFLERFLGEKAVADIEIEANNSFGLVFEDQKSAMAITVPPISANKMRVILIQIRVQRETY